jgi:uncharacterized membrane protein
VSWRDFWLFLHIMSAIVAFGPTFAFPFLGAMSAKEPQHGNFVARATELIARRLIVPFSLMMLVTGVILIFVGGWDLLDNAWLLIAIVLYAIAFVFSVAVQSRNGVRLIELTREPPPPGASGPPPELAKVVARLRLGGMFLSLMVLSIVALMVFKPG